MNHKLPGENDNPRFAGFIIGGNHPLPGQATPVDNAGAGHANLKWCTIACDNAVWPKEYVDGSNSCRTFNALWCRALEQHVTRNAPCALEHGARRPKAEW